MLGVGAHRSQLRSGLRHRTTARSDSPKEVISSVLLELLHWTRTSASRSEDATNSSSSKGDGYSTHNCSQKNHDNSHS